MENVEEDLFVMNKKVLSVANISDESDEKAFWLSKTPIERMKVVEYLRQISYGYDPTTERLQRILESSKL